jgi:hypothetical protein
VINRIMQNPSTKIITFVAIMCIAVLAAGAFFVLDKPTPKPAPEIVPVEKVFVEGQNSKDFVQVSLYTLLGFKDGKALGNGHVRYSDGTQIFGYGSGKNGAQVFVVFEDQTSDKYQSCSQVLQEKIPFRQELFIAGEGITQTAPPSTTGGAARVQLKKITNCGFVDSQR